MRGQDEQQLGVFSYVNPEQRVPQDHPLRPIRTMVDEILKQLSPQFNKMYAKGLTIDASAQGINEIMWFLRPSKLAAIAKSGQRSGERYAPEPRPSD